MPSSTNSIIFAAVALASNAMAQSSPVPTSTVLPLPFLFPYATSMAGDVVSVDSRASAATFAVTCMDGSSCPSPSSGTYILGVSTIAFSINPTAGWNCPVASNTDITCTVSADGETNTRTDMFTDLLPLSATGGVADPVTITQGWEHAQPLLGLATASSTTGPTSTSASSSASSTGSSSSSSSRTSGSSTTASQTSSSTSSSASASATGGNSGERLIASSGILGAAALLVGAIVA